MAAAKGVADVNIFGGSKEKSRFPDSSVYKGYRAHGGSPSDLGKGAHSSGRSSERVEENFFRVTPLATGSNQAAQKSMPIFDEIGSTGLKPPMAPPAKGCLPVFDVVPTYNNDIFEGVPGIKRAENDDVFNGAAVNYRAPLHVDTFSGRSESFEQTSKLSSHKNSPSRWESPKDLSSGATKYDASTARSRLPRHQPQYQRQSQQPSLVSLGSSPHKANKADHISNFCVDPVDHVNQQSAGSSSLDFLDALSSMTYHAKESKNTPLKAMLRGNTARSTGVDANNGFYQSASIQQGLDVREANNGNKTLSSPVSRSSASQVRSVRQQFHGTISSPDAVHAVNDIQGPLRSSQLPADLDRLYQRSSLKGKERPPHKPSQQAELNVGRVSKSSKKTEAMDLEEVWLTIDNIRLVTKPTSAPPPARSPPPLGLNKKATVSKKKSKSNNRIFAHNSPNTDGENGEKLDFVDGAAVMQHNATVPLSGVLSSSRERGTKLVKTQVESVNLDSSGHPGEHIFASKDGVDFSTLSQTEAIKRAEALLKLGKELEEKEKLAKAAKEAQKEKENVSTELQGVGGTEYNHTDMTDRDSDQLGSWRSIENQRTKSVSTFGKANQEAPDKVDKMPTTETRERAEREAVERATVEARERAAAVAAARNKLLIEARERAAAQAREKAATEAREKAAIEVRERAAVEARERAAAEARERVAAEARERAATEARERAAVEARERDAAEARERAAAEARAARERVAAEARERAAAEARDRAAAEARARAAAEARERAAAEARERVAAEDREKTAAEARERAVAEAREKAAAEARERAAAEAREKAAAEARERAATEEREKTAADARDRAAAEARDRAAAEAREKAAAEARKKAAIEAREKAAAEAREKAVLAERERLAAEAREKMAEEEKDRIDLREKEAADERGRMAAEARERKAAEARDRAAVERAMAEARARSERAAAQRAIALARERAADKANAEALQRDAERAAVEMRARAERVTMEKSSAVSAEFTFRDNGIEQQFMNLSRSRANSAQKLRPGTPDAFNSFRPDKTFPNKEDQRVPGGDTATGIMSSTTVAIPDDWEAFFDASTSIEVQETRGQSHDRRKVEREQRTAERVAKALAEKNRRDLDLQQQQMEKHRVAASLDAEISRWAAGKEGNLRALLSTLHYVLWPECGWRPVSISDLITAADVKKIYRKATLCVHPDKVQQKGCSVQQKYIAEKVFDLLKEAWNRFTSAELF